MSLRLLFYVDNFCVAWGTDGTQIWLATYGGGGDNEGHRVAVDSEDNVIVTGISQPYFTYAGFWDYHTINYKTVPAGGGLSGAAIAGIAVGALVAGGLIS